MVERKHKRKSLRRGYLGVWDPTGGEAREGSGLPVEKGEEEIHILAHRQDGGIEEVRRKDFAGALGEPDAVLWVDLLRPGNSSKELLEGLGLNPLTVEDCLSPLRMPKIDILADGAFVAAFAARVEAENWVSLRAVEVDLVFGGNYLVTVRDGPVTEVQERLGKKVSASGNSRSGASLAYEVMDALVDGHLPALVEAATAAEELEESLDPRNERASVEVLENLISLRRDLQAFRRLAVAQQEGIRRLSRYAPELRDHLSDVADNQREAVDMAEATRDHLDGAIEAYRMRRDERSELGIRRLTVLAAIIGPPTLLAGIYGMNFENLPGAEVAGAFWLFIGLQVVFVAAAVWFMRRSGLF
ncbi:MAG: hypothetical protein M3N10_07860 [Actinomycetota bacterium]|nr:hypothetical protein [Actinomycetota bacterium]